MIWQSHRRREVVPPNGGLWTISLQKMATSAVNEDGNLSGVGCPRPSQTNLSLHIRCVAGEEMVNMYLALLDGTVITLNR